MKLARRKDLLRILRLGHAESQQAIVAALREAGHDVTQATVSRDLSELGATKVRLNGGFVYRLPDEVPRGDADLVARNLARTLAEFVLDVRTADSLVVLKTAPGHASAVARAIDQAPPPQVVGTVAGDDTIFVATGARDEARFLADRWTANGG